MVIQVSDDHEDFEDIEYFMSKLEKKIDHYIESGETAVYHWDKGKLYDFY